MSIAEVVDSFASNFALMILRLESRIIHFDEF